MAGAGGGPCFSAPPLARLRLPHRRPRSKGELSRRPHPAREASLLPRLLPPLPRAVPGPRRPRCPRLRSVRLRCRPHYLSRRPSPAVRGPWARAGRPQSRSAQPEELSAVSSRAGFHGLRRAPSRPHWGPGPAAAAAAPGGGGGMEQPPPPPPPLPPRSRAEGREGSAPRQDPPLRPPPATSTPSLAPSQAPRALPLNRSESAKEGGKREKIPPRPCPARRRPGGAERSAEPRRHRRRRGAPSPARPHGGGAGAAGARSRNRDCARRGPASPRPCPPRGELDPGAGDVWGRIGKGWGPLTPVFLPQGEVARVRGHKPSVLFGGPPTKVKSGQFLRPELA
jgi:hypothetical protein